MRGPSSKAPQYRQRDDFLSPGAVPPVRCASLLPIFLHRVPSIFLKSSLRVTARTNNRNYLTIVTVRFIQPRPTIDSPLPLPHHRVACELPLRFIRFRYPHHAAASGYDRLCDYVAAPTIRLSSPVYWLGETVLRPAFKLMAQHGGKRQYSRYDGSMEFEVLLDMMRRRNQIYHFIYAEKSFHLSAMMAGRRGHRFVGTVHLPGATHQRVFASTDHFKLFSHIITMDRKTVPILEQMTGKRNVTWIPHGTDTDYFKPKTRRKDGHFRIGFAGSHERDFDMLREVVNNVCLAAPKADFHLVGRDNRLAALARAHPAVRLYRDVNDEDYRTLFQSLDLFVLPLKMSTVCNSILEALACGVPIVTTTGGIEDYLDRSCAITVAPGDTREMITAILHECDPAKPGRLSKKAARQRALAFSWNKVAEQHLTVFERVARQNGT